MSNSGRGGAPTLQQGRIIWARVFDPKGQNPKERPAVIVTATAEILPGQPIVAVAITGELPQPLPPEYVELPWHPKKHPRTGLRKRCAAQCEWLCIIEQNHILEVAGLVPPAKMQEILAKIPKGAAQATLQGAEQQPKTESENSADPSAS